MKIKRFACCLTALLTMSPVFAAEPKLPGAKPVFEAANYGSLQEAIDAVPRTGGLLRLPPGEFVIDKPLLICHDDLRIEGAGTATCIRNDDKTAQPAIIIKSTEPHATRRNKPKDLWRVALANFRVIGNDKSGHGIEAVAVNELFLQGLTVSYHGGDGIHCVECYEDLRLNDSLLTYNKQAGFFATGNHDNVISGNQFEENLDAVRFIDGFNLTMTGNNVDDHVRHGVVIENTYGSVVSGNMIEECQGTAIVLDRDCYGIALSSNAIAHESGGGIDLRDAHGIAVTGNAFPLCHKFGLRIGKDASRISVTGNTFSDSWVGDKPHVSRVAPNDPNRNEAQGILLEGTSDVMITGNVLSGLQGKPLTIIGECPRVTFVNNTVVPAPEAATAAAEAKR